MIPSLHITGFKLFRDLELPKLGGLNLFVGKNNTGKTCLLEAVELYASSSPWDILRVAARREPNGNHRHRIDRFDPFELSAPLQPLLSLFHREREESPSVIQLVSADPAADFRLECAPFLHEILEAETSSSESGKLEPQSRRKQMRHLLQDGMVLSRGKKGPLPLFFEIAINRQMTPGRMTLSPERNTLFEEEGWLHPNASPVAFLPARGFTTNEAKRLWDKASLADKDELLLELLRFVEPEVRDLRYISDPESGVDLPYLKINGDRGRTPLDSLGDGLTRLFHIGLAMANASGGILLIDEFENGLHWEVQEQLWKALFNASNHFGVQVFATTHSNDCIQAFVGAQKDRLIPSESYVYRLERRGEDIRAHEFSAQGLEAAIRQGIEVR